jgi:hypothetical protein
MAKLPALQFYIGDWLKDPKLSMCSPATRGIWIDLICGMHELERSGIITGTYEQLARLCRCTSEEMRAAISELNVTKAADVTECNGNVTVKNRRMQRESKEREDNNKRVRKYRGNDDVTEMKRKCNDSSSSSSSISSSKTAAATCAREAQNSQSNGSAAAAFSLSKFSLEQCTEYVRFLISQGRKVTSVDRFARSLFENATADGEIEEFLKNGGKQKRKAVIPG